MAARGARVLISYADDKVSMPKYLATFRGEHVPGERQKPVSWGEYNQRRQRR